MGEKDERKNRVYVGFIDVEVYDKVNREVSWQVLRMYNMGGKPLSVIKNMYLDSLAYVRVKGDDNEWFRIDSGVRQGSIMPPWLFNVHIGPVMKEEKMGMRRMGVRFLEKGRD